MYKSPYSHLLVHDIPVALISVPPAPLTHHPGRVSGLTGGEVRGHGDATTPVLVEGRGVSHLCHLSDSHSPPTYSGQPLKNVCFRWQYLCRLGTFYCMYGQFSPPDKKGGKKGKKKNLQLPLWRGLPFSTYSILHAIWTHTPPFCM